MHLACLPAFLVAAWREMHAAFPAECCGLLWGSPRGHAPCDVSPDQAADLPQAILCIEPLPNLRPRSDRFEIDPLAAARAERRARRAGFRLLGYYHAHPDGAVAPSELDRIGECWPGFGPRLRLIVAPPRRWALYRIDRRDWTFVAGNAASPVPPALEVAALNAKRQTGLRNMNIRLSQRVAALQPSATLAMTAKARELREAGVDVIAFAAGEPDFDTPAHITLAARQALEAGHTRYASPASGINPLRQAVADYLKRYCAIEYAPACVSVNVGAKDSIYLALQAVIDPGDEVLIPVPYWVSYPEQVRLAGGVPVEVRPHNGLKISAEELRAALTPRTRLLIMNSPNNPSGAVYTRVEQQRIADVLRDTDVLVLSDEIYHRLLFVDEPFTSFAALPGMFERTLTVNGCSKTYAMTGWRLGFIAGPRPIIDAVNKLQGQATSGAVTFVQHAAVTALSGDQECVERMRQVYARRGRRMADALNAMPGVACPGPQGAFYCFPDVGAALERLGLPDADAFAERVLSEAHVALVSGVAFGCPRHVRLSYATSDHLIEEGLGRLAAFLAR